MCGLSSDADKPCLLGKALPFSVPHFAHLCNKKCSLRNFLFSHWPLEGGLQGDELKVGAGSHEARAVLAFPALLHFLASSSALGSREALHPSALLFTGLLSEICLEERILLLKRKNDLKLPS